MCVRVVVYVYDKYNNGVVQANEIWAMKRNDMYSSYNHTNCKV